jgi:hypothetical protein
MRSRSTRAYADGLANTSQHNQQCGSEERSDLHRWIAPGGSCEEDHKEQRYIETRSAESLVDLSCSNYMADTSKGVPQFATAEFAPNAPTMTCTACGRPIAGAYFQINGAKACPECTRKAQAQTPTDSHATFVRALAFGIAGALAGFTLYVIFALATGLVIGFVSLAVGFIVGKAMSYGSRGVGGRRYQVAAALLTYLAVSMSAVPIAIHQMREHRTHTQSGAATPSHAPMNLPRAIAVLTLVGIASPFLDLQNPVHGLIGLVILFVGIRFAWRFTAGPTLTVSGPHTPSPAGVI